MRIHTFDIIEYLEDSGIDYSTQGHNVSPGWIGINCFFCADPSNHLGINLYSKSVTCWSCGKHKLTELIQAIEHCGYSRVQEIIDKYQDRTMAFSDAPERKPGDTAYLPAEATKNFPPLHREYLLSRNFDPDFIIRKYDLYACYLSGDYAYRIIIPIYQDRELVAFTSRDVTGEMHSRYKTSPIEKSKINPRDTVYNMDTVKDIALIVEGPIDVWRIGDGAVCTFGTQFTKAQLARFSKVKQAFVMFDSAAKDPRAPDRAEQMAYDLSATVRKVEVLSLSQGDPGDLDFREVKALRHDIFLRG